ncbi:heavy metal-binding domain-containing protein [Solirubrum puertoriconensis]|uniref:Heavy metal binding domain-containing protein n=1 Tax=Solirubrum puertoriconensis TaxID=1751427 RepID=A0A9X0HKX7_SOLP1|nr:heavy metal-binding domain-containing protein [Solirubrum puertoriconensis]KUG07812.1 hypothetical protein ASU33_16020 [Solirubrum puertoriconensis]
MKRLLIPLLASATFLWAACTSNESSPVTSAPAQPAAEEAHQHGAHTEHGNTQQPAAEQAYACPMHPDVTSDKPGTCPKCGMTLVRTTNTATPSYQMNVAFTPAQLTAGKPITMSFRPQATNNAEAQVPLAVVHEKKMHLIIVSQDLSEFYHEHPELQASGRYEVPFTFKTGGPYVLYQDYQPEGSSHQLARQEVTVAGPRKPAFQFRNEQLRWQQNGYQAVLSFDKPTSVGQPTTVSVQVSRNGQPVTDLDNYLGAKGHMVVISQNTEQYLHVHPQEARSSAGSAIGFNSAFEQPGIYRVFLQFKHAGQVQTADFTLNVVTATT